jgi:hypothetical protein
MAKSATSLFHYLLLPGATMALDAYLQLGDIKGDSTDDKHRGWIEVVRHEVA